MFTELASKLFATPIATVSFLETERQRFRAAVGLEITETPIEQSFCAHAVKQPDQVLYVPDATLDPRFATNPLVTADQGIRFYAGVPIRGAADSPVGALCVIDRVPREVDDDLLGRLRELAAGVDTTLRLEATVGAALKQDAENRLPTAMLAAVFQAVDAAILVTRANGVILLSNARCHELLGHGAEELARLRLQDLVAPEQLGALAAADAGQLEAAAPYRLDCTLLGGGGARVQATLSATLVQRRGMPAFRVVTLHRRQQQPAPQPPPGAKPIRTEVIGCIEFLGMQPIKAAYGAKWEAVRNRLMLAAENILKRRLSPEDAYTRTEEDGFSIWFRHGSEEENANRIARIRREVQTMLLSELGEDAPGTVAAYTQTAELEDAGAHGEIMKDVSRRLAERRREAEQQARALLARVMEERPREASRILGRNGAPIKGAFVDLPRTLRGRFSGALSLIGGPDGDIDAECLRLSLAAESVMEDLAEGLDRPCYLTLPLAFLLSRRGRERFQTQWRAMPAKVGSQIFVMLTDAPAEISPARVFEVKCMLKPITRGVGVVLDQIETLPIQSHASVLSMVGLSSEAVGGLRDAKLAGVITRLHQVKIPVLVRLAPEEAPQRWYGLGADYTTLG